MRHTSLVTLVLNLTLIAASAHAGIVDSPLPAGFKLLYSVPGIIGFGSPYFACTNVGKTPAEFSVEVFIGDGGPPFSSANVEVPSGGTRTIAYFASAEFPADRNMGLFAAKSSVRIIATSAKFMCNAFLLVDTFSGKFSTLYLPMIAKAKQKAAN